MSTGTDTTRFEVDDRGIARLTLDRPGAANSRNQRMREELLAAYARIVASTHEIRVLVLTGIGDRFFCAGMDLKESAGAETAEQRRARLSAARDIDVLSGLPVPTIAAINGYALGGGLEMALACDLRIAADHAQLGLPELRHGLVPGGGGTQRLPRLIGVSRALELMLTTEPVDAARAEQLGLVNRVVPRGRLASHVDELAARIAGLPADPVHSLKRLVASARDRDLADGLADEFETLLRLMGQRTGAH